MTSEKRKTDVQQKGLDMTLALTGPDNVQKDKRFHNQTEHVLQILMKNSQKEQRQ